MRTLKTVLAVAIGCFILAGVYISTIIVERQDALKNLARDNVSVVAAQTVSELVRFKRLLSDQALQDEGVDRSQIQLRYKSILDRAQHLTEGDFAEFLLQSPERQTAVRQFKEGLAAVQPSLENLTSSTIQDAHRLLDDVELPLAALVSLAQQYNGDRVARDQSVLTRLHWLFSTLGSGLILFGCVLIVLLGWRNRLLVRAQEELRRFAENFQNMSVKLERTNKALSAAYAELQLRNESLQSQELELRTRNERFNAALDNMSHGLCMVGADERIIVFNARFAQLFHLDEAVAPGTTLSRSVDRLLQSASPCNQALAQIYSHQRDLMRERRHSTFTLEFADGRSFAIAHQPMSEGGWVATYEDITERRQAESQIAYMAHHDALTDLANRVLFRHEMEYALAGMQGRATMIAVLFLDLDRFKDVNDSLGHETGDALLKIVAERLRRCLREGDVVARLGGDEFAVLQLGVRERSDCSALAMRIVDTIGMPYELDGQEIVIGASVGIALAETPDETPDQLLKHADLALYHAKASGRGTFRFFEPQMDAELQARRVMEADLRKALANAEFELFYQPQVCLHGERVSAFEALVRWRHPDRGMVSPGEFIPIAEDIGLIVPLGEWVIEQACLTAAAWPEDIMIAVNLSSAQLRHKSLVHCVSRALAQAGLAANRLELEITESVLLQDNDATTAMLHQLRRLGVRIALDDFGTGYSSLSYLRSFPFDKIKIDQSFVRELSSRADCFAIVQSLANLGEMLGMSTVAEGVETEDQLDQIRAAGCTNVQGFYFGRPKPVHELHHHLAASGRTAALI